jgi:hypothetical protein
MCVREREHAIFHSHFQNFCTTTSTTEQYTILDTDTEKFHLYIDSFHEAIQLLHQAYVFSFKYVLLLIGDASRNIIRGASETVHYLFSSFTLSCILKAIMFYLFIIIIGLWIRFADSLLELYGVVLEFLYKHSL